MLRLWSGNPHDGWPSDDFSVDENLADMEWHYGDHLARTAFTLTVLTPAEDEVLGCIYIVPFAPLMDENPQLDELIVDDSALIRFWAIEPRLADGFDARLLQKMLQWLDQDWSFTQIFFHVYETHYQQIEMFKANGLVQVADINLMNRGGRFLLFAPLSARS